jgi:hypothetical protein
MWYLSLDPLLVYLILVFKVWIISTWMVMHHIESILNSIIQFLPREVVLVD